MGAAPADVRHQQGPPLGGAADVADPDQVRAGRLQPAHPRVDVVEAVVAAPAHAGRGAWRRSRRRTFAAQHFPTLLNNIESGNFGLLTGGRGGGGGRIQLRVYWIQFLSVFFTLLGHKETSNLAILTTLAYFPNRQRTLNKLPTELQCRNFVNKHRLSTKIGAKRAKTCVHRVHIPAELPFCVPPLVVGIVEVHCSMYFPVLDVTSEKVPKLGDYPMDRREGGRRMEVGLVLSGRSISKRGIELGNKL